ncbi:unnamed protein product [Phytophthora fragariaefolia]|uniref:Unnamed protein product n=1 Tax=Phytophthora fragariaefolia TaxID=1490495 RepID=A0A9W6TU48_9STRA|nr:unnamed protein product [Phytophthora fragariaefolia]
MAAADGYEAYVSGDEAARGLQLLGEAEDEYEDGFEDDELEVEDVSDDEPMRITGRLFLGSIDAARNVDALRRLRVGVTLALLGEGEEKAAVSTYSSAVRDKYAEMQIDRTSFEIEDSQDGDLLRRLPEILAALGETV